LQKDTYAHIIICNVSAMKNLVRPALTLSRLDFDAPWTSRLQQRGGTNHFMPHLPPAGKFRIFPHPSDRARVVRTRHYEGTNCPSGFRFEPCLGSLMSRPQLTYGHGGRTGISASYCSVRASPQVLTSKIRDRGSKRNMVFTARP
jgi:hypothetical protein